MTERPCDEYCPECGEVMSAQMPSMPGDWPGADEYDHYWCDVCSIAYDLDDFGGLPG